MKNKIYLNIDQNLCLIVKNHTLLICTFFNNISK